MRIIGLLFLISFIACNQESSIRFSGDLEVGVQQSDSLGSHDAKSYLIQVDSGSFVSGYVDQVGVDAVIELQDAQSEVMESFDVSAVGPEYFSFVINKSGAYTLEVTPYKEDEGEYAIIIEKAEPIASDPGKRVDQFMSIFSGNVPGACVGVVQDGKMIFSKSYGKANMTHDLNFELDMPTNIGSVSKQFTAMAILLLEKEGKLSLDDDVRKYIPELPDLGEVVKIRNILNHTNGWREVYNLMPIRGWDGEDKLLKKEVLNVLQKQTELQASPGEEYNYNNSAFIMAAEIVERISGIDFPEFIKENIFDPLDMTHSYVRRDPSTIIPKATQGYSNGDNGYVESGDLYAAYGAGGIYTTPDDLVKWLNNLESATVGGADVIEKLVTPGILNNGDTMTYALGIAVDEYKGLKMYAHSGADIAHRAMMVYLPDIKAGVITLSNNSSFSGDNAYKIIDVFFSEYLEKDETENEDEEDYVVNEETLEKYVGKYKSESVSMIIEYKLEDGVLVAYPSGQSSLNLVPTSENAFDYSGIEASVVFESDDNGDYNLSTHTQGGTDLEFKRMAPFNSTFESLGDYTGRYFSEELETFYSLTVKDSMLTAMHRNMEDITLFPTAWDVFDGDVNFIGEVAFKRDAKGDVYALTISNGRTQGILFERQ